MNASARRTVLFVNATSEIGGADVALLEICRHLDPDRFDRVVVLPDAGPLTALFEGSGTTILYVDAAPLKRFRSLAGWFSYPLRFLAAVVRLARCFRRARPSLVHVNSIVVPSAALAARLCGLPCVWEVREVEQLQRTKVIGWLLRTTVRLCADAVVAPSRAVADALSGTAGERTVVVPHGIDTRRFTPSPDGRSYRAELGIPASAPVVGFVGRFAPLKGLVTLVEAFRLVRAERPDAWLVLAGPAAGYEDYLSNLKRRVAELQLSDRVLVLPALLHTEELFRALDVTALPSLVPEAFGLVVVESLASGCPVVASSLGGPVETLGGCAAGRLVPPGQPEPLAAALLAFLRVEGADRVVLERSARQWAMDRFGLDRMIRSLTAIYDSLPRVGGGAPEAIGR